MAPDQPELPLDLAPQTGSGTGIGGEGSRARRAGWLDHRELPNIRLSRPVRAGAPELDEDQSAVRDHQGGPLLVLAGPGTGKTTTIVESVVARLTGAKPMLPEEVLVLTFGRAAARELRSRIAARLQAVSVPTVATFHAFAWQLLRLHGDPETSASRLLSGPEQDLAVREMLAGHLEAGARTWPEQLRPALATGGMARELRGLMAAVRGRGLEPEAFAALAERHGQLDWAAVADFFEEYLQVLDLRGALDYSELIHRARALVQSDQTLRGRYRAIYVDEYQDTDPAQVAFLTSLVTARTTLVAVGDPDQAIYRFRGADVRGILNFPDDFHDSDGRPAPTRVLTRSRRFGPEIRAVADAWISRVSLSPLPVAVAKAHRRPRCDGPHGIVELALFSSQPEQSAGLADLLRRAHLDESEPLAWSEMAVLVRAGTEDIPRLQRALIAAGIPVEVPASDLPLGQDPALAPLLIGLRLADRPGEVSADEVAEFLCSPLVGMTPLELRQVGRALRIADRREAESQRRPVRRSADLLAGLVTGDPDQLLVLPQDLQEALTPTLQVLAQMRAARADRVREQLWRIWSLGGSSDTTDAVPGGRWARHLWRSALEGGSAGRQADRVLDAVTALFTLADRLPERAGVTDFVASLRHQQIPAARPDDGSWHRDAVRLMTVHRAKGAQWPMVVLVGMQQDRWPDLRSSSTLLRSERLGVDDLEEPLTRRQLLDDERRLAFVAATRAQKRLVISAVDSPDPDLDQASVFIDELTPSDGQAPALAEPIEFVPASSHLSEAALLASLRTAIEDPNSSPTLRRAAADRLATLGENGSPGFLPKARPERWWGIRPSTQSAEALLTPGAPARLSVTAVSAMADCPLRWFLDRRVRASEERSENLGYGSLLHALISGTVTGDLPADLPSMIEGLDTVWGEIPYEATWRARQKHGQAKEALARYLRWQRTQAAAPVDSERAFEFAVDSDGDGGGAVMRGAIDLVDVDDEGRARVVDFKTGSTTKSKTEAEESLQLGVYQLSLQLDESLGASQAPGGGVFVFLDQDDPRNPGFPRTRDQSPLTDSESILGEIQAAESTLREESIVARPGSACTFCSFRRVCPAQAEGCSSDRGAS